MKTATDDAAPGCGSLVETLVFFCHFNDLAHPRQRGKVMYSLGGVLLLCLLAVLAGAETFVDIARFGDKKLEFPRRFRPFQDGTPSHDHLGGIFATLEAEQFQRCFVAGVAWLIGVPARVIDIDACPCGGGGKTMPLTPRPEGVPVVDSRRASACCLWIDTDQCHAVVPDYFLH